MKPLRTHPTTHAKTKVAALVAAAFFACSVAGCAEVNQTLADATRKMEEWTAANNARNAQLRAEIDAMKAGRGGQRVAQGGGSEALNKELLAAAAISDIGGDKARAAKRLDEVKRLIAAGADVNFSDAEICGVDTPLGNAIESGSLEVVRVLLENGANLNAEIKDFSDSCAQDTDRYWSLTPLTLAAKEVVGSVSPARMEILKLLIAKGADVNAFDGEGQTALMVLAEGTHSRRIEMNEVTAAAVDFLLEKGAEIEAKNKRHGWTPLMLAASYAKLDMVRLLLDRGANVNATGKAKETALALAQKRKKSDTALLRQAKPGEVDFAKGLRADINEDDKIIGLLKAAMKTKPQH